MKINRLAALLFVTVVCAVGLFFSPTNVFGQNPIYGTGRDYADQVVLDRMYMRRMRAKNAKRRAASSKSPSRGAAGRKSARRKTVGTAAPVEDNSGQAVKKVAPSTYPYVKIKRDTYQSFHSDDIKGYAVNFNFTPTGGGKTITKTFTYNYYDDMAEFSGIPAGRYTIKAEAIYNGKKYPAYLGSEYGTPTNPNGGNFAPAIAIEIKPGVDAYGYQVLETSPNELQVRVIE